jgi:membrane-associated protease RseP (regulator of RpoE activity)
MRYTRKLLFYIGLTGLTALLVMAGGAIFTGSVPAAAARDGEGWLGVRLQSLTPHLREALELDEDAEGALVAGVVPDSPADAAGIREGDLIVEIDDHPVESVNGAVDLVRDRDPGDRVLIVVQRDGRRRGLDATLGDRTADRETRVDRDVRRMLEERRAPEAREDRDESPDRPGMAPRWKQDEDRDKDQDESFGEGRSFSWHEDDGDKDDDDGDRDVRIFRFRKDGKGPHNRFHLAPRVMRLESGRGGFLGVATMGLGEQLAEYFQVPEDQGVLVTRVVEDSPAADAGLQAGDVIVAVDGKDIEDSGDLRRRVRGHDPGDTVEIEVIRKGSRKTLNATLGKARDFGMLAPPEAPMPPEPPLAPGDMKTLELHLDRLRDIPGLENLELPDIDVDVRGLDREHMQELRDQLRDLRRELRENLRENLRDIHEQLRESRGSWKEAREALREAQEAWGRDRESRAKRARRLSRVAEGTTTVM